MTDAVCRHPASGYVQGINDLVTPFLAALLSQHFDGPMELWDIETLSEETMYAVEADAYWMLCKMLDGIQDHYTNAQPGIQRTVFKLKELKTLCLHVLAHRLIYAPAVLNLSNHNQDELLPTSSVRPLYNVDLATLVLLLFRVV